MSTRPSTSSGQAKPVTEASVEIGVDGRLRVSYREVPGGRDRSAPPSLGECIAALARYRHRALTPERHRAVLAAFAACGVDLRGARRGGAAGSQGDGFRSGKATLRAPQGDTSSPARRHFRGQGDTFAPQGDGFGAIYPCTVSQASTLSPHQPIRGAKGRLPDESAENPRVSIPGVASGAARVGNATKRGTCVTNQG